MRRFGVVVWLVLIGTTLLGSPLRAQTLDPVFANSFETGVIGFTPAFSAVPAGSSNTATAYVPLSVLLDVAAAAPTFVPIISSDPSRLSVSGGGVTVNTGQSSAIVQVSGLIGAPAPVTLSAHLGNTLGASVRVELALNETNLGAEADYCVLQFPTTLSVVSGMSAAPIYGRLFEAGVTETFGAPPGWIAQLGYGPNLSDPRLLTGWRYFDANYNAQAGTSDEFQTTITAPYLPGIYSYTYRFSNDAGGSWTYCDADGAGSGPGFAFSTAAQGQMTVTDPYAGLVINEVDYDQFGTPDNNEFIELYNNGPNSIDLSTLALVLINGNNNAEYARYDLITAGSTLVPGQYLVARSATVSVPVGALSLVFGVGANFVQNGSPDGIAVIDTVSQRVLDSLSYEGSVTAAVISGFPGTYNLVEGSPFAGVDSDTSPLLSLIRSPNGTDGNNAVNDWALTTTLTPGAANFFTP
jgi:Lamin Tail Domain